MNYCLADIDYLLVEVQSDLESFSMCFDVCTINSNLLNHIFLELLYTGCYSQPRGRAFPYFNFATLCCFERETNTAVEAVMIAPFPCVIHLFIFLSSVIVQPLSQNIIFAKSHIRKTSYLLLTRHNFRKTSCSQHITF